MSKRAVLRREAAKHGGKVVIVRERPLVEVVILAPPGMVWDGHVHELVRAQDLGQPVDEVYGDLLAHVRDGVSPCRAADCDCKGGES